MVAMLSSWCLPCGLTAAAGCRDLSKPVGALSTKRLAEFRQRYHELEVTALLPQDGLMLCRCNATCILHALQPLGLLMSAFRNKGRVGVTLCWGMQRMCEMNDVKLPGSPPPLVTPPFLYGAWAPPLPSRPAWAPHLLLPLHACAAAVLLNVCQMCVSGLV